MASSIRASAAPPTLLTHPGPRSGLSSFSDRVDTHFLAHWPSLNPKTNPKAASFFIKNKIPLYTTLMYPDPSFTPAKLALATEIIATVILLDDHIDDLSREEGKVFMDALTSAWNNVLNATDSGAVNGHATGKIYCSSCFIELQDDIDNAQGQVGTSINANQRITALHVSLWRRLLNDSPIFGRALGEAHLAQIQASFSNLRGKHEKLGEYLKFRHVEGGWRVAEAIGYWLAGVETVVEISLGSRRMREDGVDGNVNGADWNGAGDKVNGVGPKGAGGRFTGLTATEAQALVMLRECEALAARHLVMVNDIISYAREAKASASTPKDIPIGETNGSHESVPLVSAIPHVVKEYGIDAEGAKNVLWIAARECERCFLVRRDEALDFVRSQVEKEQNGHAENEEGARDTRKLLVDIEKALGGIEARMAGNERWSIETGRYVV
jgi:hypothetical protein